MEVVNFHPKRLPADSFSYDLHPDYSRAYDHVLCAEIHAVEQAEADPTNRGAHSNVVFVRIVGYLLLEFFDRRGPLGEGPCKTLCTSIPSKDDYDHVFEVGKWQYDNFIHLCALDFFPLLFSFSDPPQSCPFPRSVLSNTSPPSLTLTIRPPGLRCVCQCNAPPMLPHTGLGSRA